MARNLPDKYRTTFPATISILKNRNKKLPVDPTGS
ncbi:hypothetical protein CLV48_107161 [Cecembia rubra]|uniref:Uncharacterized protein n=1 Tax=Cecembia rubra TaxID=1485585 RepID=A0A2P8E1U6_9BACT|nr:hypothetical protein CLV48_107161 [Cecembia rubra]